MNQSTPQPKYCPRCREEFVHTALRCADCDADLVLEAPAAEEDRGLPGAVELVSLVRGGPWELEQIAIALADEGVPSRIDSYPPEGGTELAIYVLSDAHPRAQQALEAFRSQSLPDAPLPGALGEQLDGCPACGSALSEAAEECPDCGLPFAVE